MHQAYNVHSILKQGLQIESIAAYDNHVIIGTRSGHIIMYSVNETAAVDMLMYNKSFSKKAITQMEVIAAENLLFVLTDNMIHVCDISRIESNFAFIHSSQLTKGCSLFALDVKTTKSTTGETATVIRVCCAIKRRLQFLYWKTDVLMSPEYSIELKDVPKAICWVDDIVCVGYRDEYVIYNIASKKPEKHDLIVTSSSHSMDPCICLMRNNLLGVSKDEYLVAIDPSKYCKQEDAKQNAQAIIEATTASLDAKNTPKPLLWSGPLLSLVWDEPYAIGRVANAIEVRSLLGNSINKDTLVQTIPELGKTKFLVRAAKGIIFAAAVSELWCIRLADIPTQRQQLLQEKKYQLAIELTQVSEEPTEVKAETIRQIHMRHARVLFNSKQFAAAMREFANASADAYDVIRLFPNLLQDQAPVVEETVVPSQPQLDDKDLENALVALIEFLLLARQKEVGKLRDTKSSSKSLLSIIDTTLLKCYLQTNDSLVASLLRLRQCHFEESEKTLKKYDKISELIILYKTNGKHKKALELLKTQSTIEGSSLHGIKPTILYLQELGSQHLTLIFEFADWVLTEHPEEGLTIFIDNLYEVESLPRANVLDFLLSKHKTLVIPYLEHVINAWNDNNTLLHNVLIKQYREKVELLLKYQNEDETTASELKQYRTKLYNLLKNSTNYSPDVVLKDFPVDVLFEERALILGRLKEHDKVLTIYIQILGDLPAATKYCEDNYEDDEDIFVTLLKIILAPNTETAYEGIQLHTDFQKPNLDVALELLNKYAVKLDPSIVFQYLPDDLPLQRLQIYLEKVLRTDMAEIHQMQIMHGLLSAEVLRLEGQIREQEKINFEINEFSVCPECKKRFANQSPFVRYPNGQIVHLSCHDRKAQAAMKGG